MTQPLLAVSNLTTSFLAGGSWKPILNAISLEVAQGETVAIVGESGSGKSVTALSIMRLIPKSTGRIEGSIRFDGQELLALRPQAMQAVRGGDIAMIFQEPMTSLNPVFTIGFQIAEALRCHSDLTAEAARAETIRLLDRVRIPAAASRFDEYPHRLSGGMRQRVMIAMALACKPRILIADEPTTALDVTIQAQILDLIKTLQAEEAMSVLFITHDMGVVAEIADRTVVMYRGDIVETDTTARLFSAPRHPYTRALLAGVPELGSMKGEAGPRHFPVIDSATGLPRPAAEARNTVREGAGPILDVAGLSTRFDIRSGPFGKLRGRVHAVEDVSFSIRAGETLALVGESGCGKSTVARSILRLIEPRGGSIRVGDQNLLALDAKRLRQARSLVQMVFQDPYASLDPRMRVGDAIAEPLVTQGGCSKSQVRDKVASLMQRVGLVPEMAQRYPHEFSGGQRQRISIARALSLEPSIIVADEPVSALDVTIKAQIVNLMLDLQQSIGIAYLFISHDMAVVERIAHRVAVMYLGEIVETGPCAEVFANPMHPYTQKLLAAVPRADPTRRHQRGPIAVDEIKSPIRTVDFKPPIREYREVAPGHLVQMPA